MKLNYETLLLNNDIAFDLYKKVAKNMPIFDFHCHLSAKDIFEDKPFKNLSDIWLSGDHYKWRLMRFCGFDESLITGNKSPELKFDAYAKTIEQALGNPLYLWSMMELKRYFGVSDVLSSQNAKKIYDSANKYIVKNNLSPQKLINQSNVYAINTTENPYDDLTWHKKIANLKNFKTKVMPGYRPDDLFNVGAPRFINCINKMAKKFSCNINDYKSLLNCVEVSLKEFKNVGSLIADNGFNEFLFFDSSSPEKAEKVLKKAIKKQPITYQEKNDFVSQFLIDLFGLYLKHDFSCLIHYGAIRNNNEIIFDQLGPDQGFDVINDQAEISKNINCFLNKLYKKYKTTPNIVFFNLDANQNRIVAAAINNFQISTNTFGKIQLGVPWWFNDHEYGMHQQMQAFADQSVFGGFLGMLTDSRSFTSYVRFDYFRRVLCSFIGNYVKQGKFVNDPKILEKIVKQICFENAKNFFERIKK